MGKRWTPQLRAWAYRFLVARDGEYCILCGESHCKLQIDHRNGNPNNNEPENLCLLCASCNKKLQCLTPEQHKSLIKKRCAHNIRVRESLCGNTATVIARAEIDYTAGSVQMQANGRYEPQFREWLLDTIQKMGYFPLDDAMYSGAEVTGGSSETMQRYIKKMTSSKGVLELVTNERRQKVLKYKNGHNGNGHNGNGHNGALDIDKMIVQAQAVTKRLKEARRHEN